MLPAGTALVDPVYPVVFTDAIPVKIRDGQVKALKPVYTAPTEAAARERFDEFAEAWGGRYPAIVKP